jgi:hypothetical protein
MSEHPTYINVKSYARVVLTHKLRTIAISECNYATLKSLGKAGDSFNDVISKLLIDSSDNTIEMPLSQCAIDTRRRQGAEEK